MKVMLIGLAGFIVCFGAFSWYDFRQEDQARAAQADERAALEAIIWPKPGPTPDIEARRAFVANVHNIYLERFGDGIDVSVSGERNEIFTFYKAGITANEVRQFITSSQPHNLALQGFTTLTITDRRQFTKSWNLSN